MTELSMRALDRWIVLAVTIIGGGACAVVAVVDVQGGDWALASFDVVCLVILLVIALAVVVTRVEIDHEFVRVRRLMRTERIRRIDVRAVEVQARGLGPPGLSLVLRSDARVPIPRLLTLRDDLDAFEGDLRTLLAKRGPGGPVTQLGRPQLRSALPHLVVAFAAYLGAAGLWVVDRPPAAVVLGLAGAVLWVFAMRALTRTAELRGDILVVHGTVHTRTAPLREVQSVERSNSVDPVASLVMADGSRFVLPGWIRQGDVERVVAAHRAAAEDG